MPGAGLKIDVRRNRILEILARDGQVRVAQLSELLGATVVTIRNDLDELEKSGYLQRTPGGAVQTAKNYSKLLFLRRSQENETYKHAVSLAAAKMISNGETVLINSGTTTFFTALQLKKHLNLNIVTNSIYVAKELGGIPSFRVLLLGGEINAQYSFTYGSDALEQLQKYKADKALLSMSGIGSEPGLTTYHADEAALDRMMIERARQTIVAADKTKLDFEGFSYVAPAEEIDTWVTNDDVDPAGADKLRTLGVEIALCPPL